MDGDNVVGSVGHLTVPVPAGGSGEVVVAVRGGTEAFAAFSDQPIAKHTEVLIVSQLSARSVVVTPFSTRSDLS